MQLSDRWGAEPQQPQDSGAWDAITARRAAGTAPLATVSHAKTGVTIKTMLIGGIGLFLLFHFLKGRAS